MHELPKLPVRNFLNIKLPNHRSANRWIVAIFLTVLLVDFRIPWLEADGGNSGMWAYGFFNTDEGFYTNGGRSAYLTGKFYDTELQEPFQIKASFGMHLLSYLSYCIRGLSFGSSRLPTIIFAIAAWLSVYYLASKVTPPLLAGLLTLMISCNPVTLTYERVASSDVLVGAITAISCACIYKKNPISIAIAGMLLGLGFWIKLTIVGLLPLLFLYSYTRLKQCPKLFLLLTSICLVTFLAILIYYQKNVAILISNPETLFRGTGELATDLKQCTLAFLCFPRIYITSQFGPLLFWSIALTTTYFVVNYSRTGRVFTSKTAIPIGIIVYFLILSIQLANSIRYFLPFLYFVPLILIYSRQSLRRIPPKLILLATFFVLTGLIISWIQIKKFSTDPSIFMLQERHFLPPDFQSMAWILRAVHFLVWFYIAMKLFPNTNSLLILCTLISYNVILFAGLDYMNWEPRYEDLNNQILWHWTLFLLFVSLSVRGWKTWYVYIVSLFILFSFLNSSWKKACGDLAKKTYVWRDTSSELAKLIPEDSIIVGRKATSLFRDQPYRLGLTEQVADCPRFVNNLLAILQNHPNQTLYWLIERDDRARMKCLYLLNQKKVKVEKVKTILLPHDFLKVDVPIYFLKLSKI
jgi:4-amino-4-deoxy-L-arabinose transferase-like glycosyltransferase